MKKKGSSIISAMLVILLFVAISLLAVFPASSKEMGKGWPHYVNVIVDWDPTEDNLGDWNVYAQEYYVETHPGYNVGDWITGCSDCLEMEYDFEFVGSILKFEEIYVSGVDAYPQTHAVVLHDPDGDGVYTGSITARYDFPSERGQFIRMDVIEYTVTTIDDTVTYFYYVEKEYKKPIEEE
jgi:hypothetical protein